MQVVGFDGSTTIEEFCSTLTKLIGCRGTNQSGFSIFSDDPITPELQHSLNKHEKVSSCFWILSSLFTFFNNQFMFRLFLFYLMGSCCGIYNVYYFMQHIFSSAPLELHPHGIAPKRENVFSSPCRKFIPCGALFPRGTNPRRLS